MPLPATINVCRADLFTSEDELRDKYDEITVQRVLRIRALYCYLISNPDAKDRQCIEHDVSVYGISQSSAYNDLAIIKALLPMLSKASRDFHRWRANEMLLETYRKAKELKDTKTMEKAASSYAKYNRVDLEDEQILPYEEIVVQPFTATDDPTPLGIKPIPNIQERIKKMLDKYIAESIDIQDVEFEECDLEEAELFSDLDDDSEEKI